MDTSGGSVDLGLDEMIFVIALVVWQVAGH